jgi:hypothetical protein
LGLTPQLLRFLSKVVSYPLGGDMVIPKVTAETMMPILKDADQEDYINCLLERIDTENPIVSKMMREFCCKYSHDENSMMPVQKAIAMAALVYRQIESQAEANLLEFQLKL